MNRSDRTSRIEQEIDTNLKRAYEEVANQELPSRFTDLLEQLRSQDVTLQDKSDADDE